MIVNQTPYPINFEMKAAQALTCRYGEVGRQYKFIADIDLTGLSANLQVIKPDGTFVIEEATVTVTEDEQYIVAEIPLQATVVKGVCRYDINLFQDEDLILYTAEGPLWVDDPLVTEDMIESVAEVYGLRFPQDFLTVENLVDIVNYVKAQIINDEAIAEDTTWSSQKIEQEISAHEPDVDVTDTAEGNPIEITDAAAAPFVKCVTQITGSQDLHGYDKPWVGGAGKNKCPKRITPTVFQNVTITPNQNGSLRLQASNSEDANIRCHEASYINLPNGTYIGTIDGKNGFEVHIQVNNVAVNNPFTVTNADEVKLMIYIPQGQSFDITIFPMIRLSSVQDATWAPYENICPITAYTEGDIEVSDGDGNTTTHTTTYPSAIYRGSEDVVNGEVTTEKKKMILNGSASETYAHNTGWADGSYVMTNALTDAVQVSGYNTIADLICNQAEAEKPSLIVNGNYGIGQGEGSSLYIYLGAEYDTEAKLKTYLANNPLEIVYELATPTTSSVTPTNLPIKSLSGYNHIESSTGDMEVEYITEEYQPLVDLIQSSSHVYSTAEQVVGKWIDGKDIYERSINLGSFSLSGGGTRTIETISGIDKFLWYEGYAVDGVEKYTIPDFGARIKMVSNDMKFQASPASGWNVSEGYVTIRYTKTS